MPHNTKIKAKEVTEVEQLISADDAESLSIVAASMYRTPVNGPYDHILRVSSKAAKEFVGRFMSPISVVSNCAAKIFDELDGPHSNLGQIIQYTKPTVKWYPKQQ